jgi:hypothetical protein
MPHSRATSQTTDQRSTLLALHPKPVKVHPNRLMGLQEVLQDLRALSRGPGARSLVCEKRPERAPSQGGPPECPSRKWVRVAIIGLTWTFADASPFGRCGGRREVSESHPEALCNPVRTGTFRNHNSQCSNGLRTGSGAPGNGGPTHLCCHFAQPLDTSATLRPPCRSHEVPSHQSEAGPRQSAPSGRWAGSRVWGHRGVATDA